MGIKQPQILSIQSDLTAKELMDKLDRITTEEFHDAVRSPEYKYYGKISGSEFDIRNKKYGPYSNGPGVSGKISEQDNLVLINIKIDIEEEIEVIKKMIFSYSVFFGLFIIGAGACLEETRLIAITVGALMLASPFIQMAIIKRLLKSMQKEELDQFMSVINA